MIFDAHLDLAFNAIQGRDLTRPEPQPYHDETTLVNFPSLKQAGVRICLGTLWAYPKSTDDPEGYTTPLEARGLARKQLDQYLRWQDDGHIKILTSGQEVQQHWDTHTPESPLGVIVLMEGADPLLDPEDLQVWHTDGLRVVGLAWGRTRFSGGTGSPGGLTPEGVEMVHALRELGVTLDLSHLAEQAFWEAVELHQKVIASHSNCQSLVPTDRHLSDSMIRKIAELDGMIGLVLFSSFIKHGFVKGMPKETVSFADLVPHALHMADLVGWDHIGLGSDLDGGFGMERTPRELQHLTDLQQFFDLLPAEAREKVQFQNWLNWFSKKL